MYIKMNSDFKETNIVVQANDLVQTANWSMNVIPLKIFKGLISCIDVMKPGQTNQVTVMKSDLYRIVGIDKSKNNYTYLRKQMESLMQQIVYLKKEDKIIQVPLVSKVIWNMNNDFVSCFFDEELMPYIIHLNGLFLQYPVGNLVGFSSKYGLILYEYLLSLERQYKRGEHIVDIEVLRHITGTEKKYNKTFDFENRVLNASIEDINHSGVEFLVRYTTVKYNRAIKSVKFELRPRTSIQETEFETIMNPSMFEKGITIMRVPGAKKAYHDKRGEKETLIDRLSETYKDTPPKEQKFGSGRMFEKYIKYEDDDSDMGLPDYDTAGQDPEVLYPF